MERRDGTRRTLIYDGSISGWRDCTYQYFYTGVMEGTGTGLDAGPGSDSMISFSHVILMNFNKSVPILFILLRVNVDRRILRHTILPQCWLVGSLARGLRGFRDYPAVGLWGRCRPCRPGRGGRGAHDGPGPYRQRCDRQKLLMRLRHGTGTWRGILVVCKGYARTPGQRQCQTEVLLFFCLTVGKPTVGPGLRHTALFFFVSRGTGCRLINV